MIIHFYPTEICQLIKVPLNILQWIGLREKLQESPDISMGKISGFRLRVPLKQSIEYNQPYP